MTKEIKIRVFPDGHIESETVGIKGKACLKYIKKIEDLTGAKTVNSAFTEEFNETESEQNYTYNEDFQNNENKH